MPRVLTSRPDPEEDTLSLHALSEEELELISALIGTVRLGRGNKYKEAAFDLITKIENIRGDKFLIQSCDAVNFFVEVMDSRGNVIDKVAHDFVEINIP